MTKVAEIAERPGRIQSLDVARTIMLLAMVVYHFTYDLAMFGLIAYDIPRRPEWVMFARIIASSFLFLSGISLWLAHTPRLRWRAFARRLAVILAAAMAITVATYAFMPAYFVYFGILHSIAAASVVGLAFLRLPPWITLATALFVFQAPTLFRGGTFDLPWLSWLGFSTSVRPSMDFEPIFPWAAALLVGVAVAQAFERLSIWQYIRAAERSNSAWLRRLGRPGRHSLVVYLLHQPMLLTIVWALSRFL